MRSAQSIVDQFAAFVANKTKSVLIEELRILSKEVGFVLPTVGYLSVAELGVIRSGFLAELQKLRTAESALQRTKAYKEKLGKKYVPPQRRAPKISPAPLANNDTSPPTAVRLLGKQTPEGAKSAGRRCAKMHAEHKAIYNRKINLPIEEINLGDQTFITLKGLDLSNLPVYGATREAPNDVKRDELTIVDDRLVKFSERELFAKRIASANAFKTV